MGTTWLYRGYKWQEALQDSLSDCQQQNIRSQSDYPMFTHLQWAYGATSCF